MTLYQIDEDTQIDEFGVDQSNFSLRDKLEYNLMRAKEKERRKHHEYYIRNDKEYKWDIPHKYDHRKNNFVAQIHNFRVINKEHPISAPVSTKSTVADLVLKRGLSKIHPFIAKALNAYNWGYMGAGYYDNWQRAKKVGMHSELADLSAQKWKHSKKNSKR